MSINQYAHICAYICAQWLFRLFVCVRIIVVWVVFAMQLYVFSLLVCVCVCVWCCLLCDCSFMKLGGPCFIVVRLIVSLHLATCLCIFSLGSFRGSPPLGNLYMLFGFSWGSEIHMWCHFGVPPLGLTEFGYDVHSY